MSDIPEWAIEEAERICSQFTEWGCGMFGGIESEFIARALVKAKEQGRDEEWERWERRIRSGAII